MVQKFSENVENHVNVNFEKNFVIGCLIMKFPKLLYLDNLKLYVV